jgi:hypothetical protein
MRFGALINHQPNVVWWQADALCSLSSNQPPIRMQSQLILKPRPMTASKTIVAERFSTGTAIQRISLT